MSTNQRANPRWRKHERGHSATFPPAHLWNHIRAGQERDKTRVSAVVHTLSPGSATARGVSSTCQPRLSPAPVDNALPTRPARHLDSPSTGPSGNGWAVGRDGTSPLSVVAPSVTPVTAVGRMGLPRCRRKELLREHHRAGVVGRPGRAGAATDSVVTTGATAPRRTSRASGRAARATAPRRRTTPPSRACSARCCCPRTPSPTSARSLRGADFYRPVARGHLRRDHRPLRPRRAGRPDHRRRRAAAPRRARPHRRRAVPPHAVGQRPDRGQRRLLRRDRPREGDPAPAGRRRHPASCRWATPARARSTTSSTRPRPRSTRSPTSAPSEDYAPLSDIMDGVLDEIEAIGNRDGRAVRRAHRLRRPRRPDQRPAHRPDDHRRGASRDGQVDPGPRPLPGGVDPQQHDQRASSAWR